MKNNGWVTEALKFPYLLLHRTLLTAVRDGRYVLGTFAVMGDWWDAQLSKLGANGELAWEVSVASCGSRFFGKTMCCVA